jgi:hypothetical protein
MWIGSKKYSSDRLCENWNLSWGKTTFTVLGINFDPFTIVEKESPDPCGLQSQNKRMYINHLKSPLLILLLHDILFHSINR